MMDWLTGAGAAAAEKAAAEKVAKQAAEKLRRTKAALQFAEEQLDYKNTGKLAEVSENKLGGSDFLKKGQGRNALNPSATSVAKKPDATEKDLVTGHSFVFIGSRMFQTGVATKKAPGLDVVVVEPQSNIAPK